MNDLDELIKAFDLVPEAKILEKQYRLYYNTDGSVVGLWEDQFPDQGDYIVLAEPDQFHRVNTTELKVIDGELTRLDLRIPATSSIVKSDAGQPVVKGMAAIPLNEYEQFDNVEYYDRKPNS